MRFAFYFLFLISFLSCSDNSSVNVPPPLVDAPFLVGDYDDYDYYFKFDPDLEIQFQADQGYTYELDLDGDSLSEIGLRGVYAGSSGGLATYQIFAFPLEDNSPWQMAYQEHYDSVYVCKDTVPWSWGNGGSIPIYYSRHMNYNCSLLIDSFYRIDTYRVPQVFGQDDDPQANWQWSQWPNRYPSNFVYFDQFDQSHLMGQYMNKLYLNFYEGFTATHYLLFRKQSGATYHYAWLKLQFDRSNRKLTLLELAGQAMGHS